MRLRLGQLADFAASLDLELERIPLCLACLSIVSSPIRHGDEREAKRSAREMTPWIWDEGLAEPALRAVRKATHCYAEECRADLELRGGRSVVARAIVLRLGAELAERERILFAAWEASRPRLALAPPEWN